MLAVPLSGVSAGDGWLSAAISGRLRLKRESDHRHHTGAKIVVGSAAGGAVVGGLMGGGKGALIGGAVGAGGGAIANKAREHHDVKKREHREETYPR